MNLYFLFILYMAITARMCGGGCYAYLLNKKGTVDAHGVDMRGIMPFSMNILPEILFGAGFGAAVYTQTQSIIAAIIATAISAGMMREGHGNAYHMGALQYDFPDRWQGFDIIARPVSRWLGFAPRSAGYCWIFMGLKWALIGLPLAPYGAALAILGPVSYWVGFVALRKDNEPAEWLTGIASGLLIYAALTFSPILCISSLLRALGLL